MGWCGYSWAINKVAEILLYLFPSISRTLLHSDQPSREWNRCRAMSLSVSWPIQKPSRSHDRVQDERAEERGIRRGDRLKVLRGRDPRGKAGPERQCYMSRQRPRHQVPSPTQRASRRPPHDLPPARGRPLSYPHLIHRTLWIIHSTFGGAVGQAEYSIYIVVVFAPASDGHAAFGAVDRIRGYVAQDTLGLRPRMLLILFSCTP
jgi:hypothetical protein